MASTPLRHPATLHGSSDLENEALAFARGDSEEAEALLARLAADAIRRWQLDEATFWQRVKFRARMIRAATTRDAMGGVRIERENDLADRP